MICPTCGAEASGNFCASCGATVTAMRCPGCEAEAPAGARFCPVCGRTLGAGRLRRPALAWVIAGGTVMALAAVLLARSTSPRSGASTPGALLGADGGGGAVAPATTDISNMTPRERADRLFNRVMAAGERGDTAQIRFFAPMAVQAYGLLDGLDADARYHVGMIQLIQGNLAEARAQADTILLAAPNHLLALLIRAEVGRAINDRAARERAWRDLLRHFDREMASGRSEYADHRTALEAARDEARTVLGPG